MTEKLELPSKTERATMTSILLNLPGDLAKLVTAAAAADGQSRTAWIVEQLSAAVQRDDNMDPALVAGFVRLTGGELDAADCPECARPFSERGGPAIGFVVGSRRPLTFGPVCAMCAHTE